MCTVLLPPGDNPTAVNKLIISYHICPSVRPRGTTRLPLDGFSRNLVYLKIFRKSLEKIQVPLTSDNNNRYFTWRTIYVFDHILPKSCQNENYFRHNLYRNSQHTSHVNPSPPPPPPHPPENRAVYEITWGNCCRAGQATGGSMAHAHYMLDT